jgi:hypothetical protein
MKIRPLYDEFGAEGYYRQHADEYQNPHFPEIKNLLEKNFHRFDFSEAALDFGAGGGEVAQVLQSLGVRKIVGCDPFTFSLFEKKTGLPCLRFGFEEVLRGADLGKFSVAFSSFALHLCPEKDLFSVVWQLFQAAPTLVILTPHKRPELERLPGVELIFEDFSLNEKGKKVRLKAYKSHA